MVHGPEAGSDHSHRGGDIGKDCHSNCAGPCRRAAGDRLNEGTGDASASEYGAYEPCAAATRYSIPPGCNESGYWHGPGRSQAGSPSQQQRNRHRERQSDAKRFTACAVSHGHGATEERGGAGGPRRDPKLSLSVQVVSGAQHRPGLVRHALSLQTPRSLRVRR